MSLVLSPLQKSWLQEIQVATPFLAPYMERVEEVKPAAKTVAPSLKKVAPTEKAIIVPVNATDLAQMSLIQLQAHVEQCQGCDLHQQRTQTVVGAGQTQQPEWFVISTAPSSHEELAGLPMQGKSGELFAAQMQSIGLNLEQQLYLTQLLKCRSSTKRAAIEHIKACKAILLKQIELIQPQRLLLLGAKAAALFLGTERPFEALCGQAQSWPDAQGRTLPVVVSYHPASLLLRPQLKAKAWHDLLLMKTLGQTAK